MEFSLSEIVQVSLTFMFSFITFTYLIHYYYTIATNYAPTAQAAAQQGKYLARVFAQLTKKENLLTELATAKRVNADPARLDSLANAVIRASNIRPFHYTHQGSLAYIGSDKAIADLPVRFTSMICFGFRY